MDFMWSEYLYFIWFKYTCFKAGLDHCFYSLNWHDIRPKKSLGLIDPKHDGLEPDRPNECKETLHNVKESSA